MLYQGHETLNEIGLREFFDQHPIVQGHPAVALVIIVIVFVARQCRGRNGALGQAADALR